MPSWCPMSSSRGTEGFSDRGAASRRDFLARTGSGFGALALSYLLARDGALPAASAAGRQVAVPVPHHAPRARAVIWVFMEGGPSHIDLFDPKPALDRMAGKPMPESFGRPVTAMGTASNTILASRRKWTRHPSGVDVSDWYPHIARHAGDLTVIRSVWADGLNHVGSVCQMNTGSILAGRPSLGSWAVYGLGAATDDLPAYVVLTDDKEVVGGPKNWSAGFLPAGYQGTLLRGKGPPIVDLRPPADIGARRARSKLDFLRDLNRRYGAERPDDTEVAARLESYELAYRMQAAAPGAVDLSAESERTKAMYGLDEDATRAFGRSCLLARRLVERGVRFVQCYSGSGSGWDAHSDIEGNHSKLCRASDKPIAGLLEDLKARGLLEETLVVWAGEFGRTPFAQGSDGRDHNPYGFSIWLAGGGIRGGMIHGATDEFGYRVIEGKVEVYDLHATMLHLLGIDHRRLTFRHGGRDMRLTDVHGEVMHEWIA
jgi:hypothetical protein